jgi:cell division septation protein DedD
MLCVKVLDFCKDPLETVRADLVKVFISEKTLSEDNIPCRVMIAKELPLNRNGKIDLYRMSRGEVEGDVYTVDPVRDRQGLRDFRLRPYEDGPADMIREVFDGITAEIKENLPFNKNKSEEEDKMNAKKAFEDWNAMNKMGRQMMQNMMSQMGQNMSSMPGMPDMSKMMGGMPDMSKMMGGMQEMNKKFMSGMPDVQGMMQKQAQTALPVMQQQMNQIVTCMSQMNQTALELMQKMFDQHCEMMNQMFEMAQKAAAGEMPKAAAKAEKPAKAEAKPAKASSKPAKAVKEPAKKADK